MGPSRSFWNGTTSALQLEEITSNCLEFRMCTINKSAHTKNYLETYLMILVVTQSTVSYTSVKSLRDEMCEGAN